MEYTPKQLSEELPLGKGVRVAAVDSSGLIAFEKPAGIMTHPNKDADQRMSLLRAAYNLEEECYSLKRPLAGGEAFIFILNRLDSPTSGLVLGALNKSIAAHISRMFQAGKVYKVYHALIKGRPSVATRLWADRLEVVRKKGHVRALSGGMRQARTQAQILKPDANGLGLHLIQLVPMTGRTHQLRLQCSLRHCPIVGDRTYGDFKFNRSIQKVVDSRRLFLHASTLRVPLPGGETFEVVSALPEAFEMLLSPNSSVKAALFS
mgnify:CR=1 FL=1